MEKKIFKPSNEVCSKQISFEYENGIMHNLEFIGGCNGNLKAIGKLCEGMKLEDIVRILDGNLCGHRKTSCADQLAKAIKEVL